MRGGARLLPDGSVHLPNGQIVASVDDIPPGTVVYYDDGHPSTGHYLNALFLAVVFIVGAVVLWALIV